MSSMDKKSWERNEQGKERQGEKRKKGWSTNSSGSSQLEKVNQELARPNLTDSARRALLKKKAELEGR